MIAWARVKLKPTFSSNYSECDLTTNIMSDLGLRQVVQNLHTTLERDTLVQVTLNQLRLSLKVERVVLYYFYRPWEGQVTFESLENVQYSIFGSKGPDKCFNGEYAAMYEVGRVRAIADIETEPISQAIEIFSELFKSVVV